MSFSFFLSGRAECSSNTNGDVMNRYSGEVSLSLSRSASGYWPSQALLSSLSPLSERDGEGSAPFQGSSEESTSHLSAAVFYLVCSRSISAADMLKSVLIFSKQPPDNTIKCER